MTKEEIAMQITLRAIQEGFISKSIPGIQMSTDEAALLIAKRVGKFYTALLKSISSDEAKDQA